jgi:ribulose-phosphate 3-epimerase
MCQDPGAYFLDAKIAGFSVVLFPFEAVADKKQLRVLAAELRELKIEPGLSVNPETSAEEIDPYVHLFSQVVLLSVQPGYQGEPFIEQTVAKAQKLRHSQKNVKIELDGGIHLKNAAAAAASGADYLVVGSVLFADGAQPAEIFEKIQAAAG